jgi:hypothetical protein
VEKGKTIANGNLSGGWVVDGGQRSGSASGGADDGDPSGLS